MSVGSCQCEESCNVLCNVYCNEDYGSELLIFLKPSAYVIHHQFNVQQLYALPTHCSYAFCIYLRTNSDLCHLQHKLIGFYNRDEKRLLLGTDWVLNKMVCASFLKG